MLIFIDLDGTIEDSRVDMARAVVRVRERFGLSPQHQEDFVAHVNRGMQTLYRNCFPEMFHSGEDDDITIERIRAQYEKDYGAHIAESTRLYAGMKEALGELNDRYGRLVCYTNKPEALSVRLLDALGVFSNFAIVMGGDSAPESKPSALPMNIAAKRLEKEQDRAVMIGDTAGDMRAAKAYGSTSIWAAWGYAAAAPEDDATPDHIAAQPRDLPSLISSCM